MLTGLDVTPPDFSITVSAVPLLIAATVGSGVCVLGALAASRTAARRWDCVEQQGMRPKNGPVWMRRTVSFEGEER